MPTYAQSKLIPGIPCSCPHILKSVQEGSEFCDPGGSNQLVSHPQAPTLNPIQMGQESPSGSQSTVRGPENKPTNQRSIKNMVHATELFLSPMTTSSAQMFHSCFMLSMSTHPLCPLGRHTLQSQEP